MADLGDLSTAELLARMAAKEFYLIENRLLTEVADLGTKLREHLLYMIDLEKSGTLFLSGPLYEKTGATIGGVTVVRASSFEEAESIASSDPFVLAGYRIPTVRRWVVNEGRVSLRLDLSDGRVAID